MKVLNLKRRPWFKKRQTGSRRRIMQRFLNTCRKWRSTFRMSMRLWGSSKGKRKSKNSKKSWIYLWLFSCEFKNRYPLTQEEIQELRDGLKHKWDLINRKFQNYAHITKIDTVGLKRRWEEFCCVVMKCVCRKENYEKELQSLERDMEKLNKRYIFVDATENASKTGKNTIS